MSQDLCPLSPHPLHLSIKKNPQTKHPPANLISVEGISNLLPPIQTHPNKSQESPPPPPIHPRLPSLESPINTQQDIMEKKLTSKLKGTDKKPGVRLSGDSLYEAYRKLNDFVTFTVNKLEEYNRQQIESDTSSPRKSQILDATLSKIKGVMVGGSTQKHTGKHSLL